MCTKKGSVFPFLPVFVKLREMFLLRIFMNFQAQKLQNSFIISCSLYQRAELRLFREQYIVFLVEVCSGHHVYAQWLCTAVQFLLGESLRSVQSF